MDAQAKSILIGIILVLIAAITAGAGVAVAIVNPFKTTLSTLTSVSLIGGGVVFWGWACFGRKEIYE